MRAMSPVLGEVGNVMVTWAVLLTMSPVLG
jgi:hypothetical protein